MTLNDVSVGGLAGKTKREWSRRSIGKRPPIAAIHWTTPGALAYPLR